MKTEHTPGPWICKEQGEANEYYLITANGKWLFAFRQNGEKWTQEQEANAKLIAVAPELLEDHVKNLEFFTWLATQDLNLWSDKRQWMFERIAATTAAIKKAVELK